MLLTSFLPGYFLLRIIDKGDSIRGGALIVVSNLLSLLVMFIVGFFILLSGKDIPSLAFPVTISIDLILAVMYYIGTRKKAREFGLALNKYEIATILSVLSIIAIASTVIALFNMPLLRSDMWTVYNYALEYSKGFPVHGDFLLPYPYLFQIYLLMLFALSGLPSAITLQMLYASSFMPVLAFYSMVKAWFNGKNNGKIPVISAYFSILLGFTVLYTIVLKLAGESSWHTLSSWPFSFRFLQDFAIAKTYGDYMLFPFVPYMIVWRWIVGLTVLFVLLYVLKENSCNVKMRYLLFSTLTALGYLGHITEVSLFVVLFFSYELFFQRKPDWKIGVSVLLGLLTVLTVDFLAPQQIYVLSVNNLTGMKSLSLPYISIVSLTILTIIVEIVKSRGTFGFSNAKQKILSIITNNWRHIRWGLLYLYFLCIVIWLVVQKDYNLFSYGSNTFVPFFIFPLRFGAIGLIAVISIAAYFPEILQSNKLSFFFLISVIGLTLEQTGNYFPLFSSDIARYYAITNIGLCIIAAYGIERSMSKRLNTGETVDTQPNSTSSMSRRIRSSINRFSEKKILSSLLLFLVITPSMLGTTFYLANITYFNGRRNIITDSELDAIEYIKNNLSPNESALTLTSESAFKLRTFAGITVQALYGTSDRNVVTQGLLATDNPYIITYILGTSNLRYVYIAPEDADLLNSKHFLFSSFLKYFSEVFRSGDVRVYEVPRLIPVSPDLESPLGVIHFLPSNDSLGFDGIDDYVELNDSARSKPTKQITVELRLKETGNLAYKFPIDQSKGQCVSYAFVGTSDQKFQFMIGIDSGTTTRKITTNTTFLDDEWHHLVGIYDGTHIAVYVDGKLENETLYAESKEIYYDGNTPLRLGTHAFGANSYFNGAVDDFRMYNRILSEDEILYSYKNKNADPKNNAGLVLWLSFDGNLKDNTGNGNNGINYGGTFGLSTMYSEKDVFTALFMSSLNLGFSILYVDDVLGASLNSYIQNYTQVIMTSDPKTPNSALLDWISSGNKLVVLNTDGDGFFAHFVRLDFQSGDLMHVKEFNSGKIIYVDIRSFSESYETSTLLFRNDLTSTVKNAIAISSYPTSQLMLGLPGSTFNMTYGGYKVKGDLNLSTDLLVMKGLFHLQLLNTTPFRIVEAGLYGRSTLNIQNATLMIYPDESYLTVKPENYPVNGKILIENSKTTMVADDSTSTLIIDELPKIIEFNATELLVSARLPALDAKGEIFFDSLHINVCPYVPLAGIVLQEARVQGRVAFNTIFVSKPTIFLTDFTLNGEIQSPSQENPHLVIPWLDVFVSPYNLIFTLIILLAVALDTIKKRKIGFRLKFMK